MKPEPLKDKVAYFDSLVFGLYKPKDNYIIPKVNLGDIKSAVEWLKEEVYDMKTGRTGLNRMWIIKNKRRLIEMINKAFEDVIKK